MNIAVLMTCHNRLEKTLRCLESLFVCCQSREFATDVFLVDDGSTDGTGRVVGDWAINHCQSHAFDLNLIAGDGKLFWAKGMALAWQTAIDSSIKYDYYLWLNDDVVLSGDALVTLLEDAKDNGVIVGSCSDPESGTITYGATDEMDHKIVPNGVPQVARGWLNGNAVLVPDVVRQKVGILSADYTHARADYDYAERLKRAGVEFFASSRCVGACADDFDAKMRGLSCVARMRLLFKPGYWNLHDLWLIRSRYYGFARAVISCLHLILIVCRYRPKPTYEEMRREQEQVYRYHAYHRSGI